MDKLIETMVGSIGGEIVGEVFEPLFNVAVIIPHLGVKLSEITNIANKIEKFGFQVVDVEISEYFNLEYWDDDDNETTLTFTLLTPE